jgi:PE family
MAVVIAAPEYLAAAATDLANIGSSIGSANSAAFGPTSDCVGRGC